MRKSYSTRPCIYLNEIPLALGRNVNVMLMYQVFIYSVVFSSVAKLKVITFYFSHYSRNIKARQWVSRLA